MCSDGDTRKMFELARFINTGTVSSVSSSGVATGLTDFQDGSFDIQDDAGSYKRMHESEETIADMIIIS